VNKTWIGGQYFLAGGYCMLVFSLFWLLKRELRLAIVRWQYSPYALLLVVGGLLLLHLYLFDRLPRRPFVIFGAVCWVLVFIVQTIAYQRILVP